MGTTLRPWPHHGNAILSVIRLYYCHERFIFQVVVRISSDEIESGFGGCCVHCGDLSFAATFAIVRFFSPPRYDALRPLSERTTSGLSMPTLDHQKWNLADHAGKVVLINYFATWCGPCVEETPELVKIANDYVGKLDMAGISLDQDADGSQPRVERLQGFVGKYQIPFPILCRRWIRRCFSRIPPSRRRY